MPYIGIEIGGTKLQLVIGEADGAILQRERLVVNAGEGAPAIRRQIEQSLPRLVGAADIRAIGIGFGGPVDWRTGRICRSHQVEGWSEFDLAGWVQRIVGKPTKVDNDANLGALGEARCGAGAGLNPVFYVTLGSGVGGGLVCDGRVYHGTTPGEAEIGHVRLDRSGTIVENRCSGWAVDRSIRELVKTQPDSALAKLALQEPGNEAKHLGAALEMKDAAAARLLQETAQDLAFALSHVTHLFHPEVIVLGGGLAKTGEPLRQAVERCLRDFLMGAFQPGPKIALATLGEDAVPAGALCLAADRHADFTTQSQNY